MGPRGVLTLTLVVSLAGALRAEDAGHETRHGIAERHVALAKKLEKKHPREAFEELLLALEMDPDDYEARTKLGYKRDENKVWQGAPAVPGASGGAMDAKLAQERDHLRKDAGAKLGFLAKHLKQDNKEADARRIAGLALEELPDEANARAILSMEKRGAAWVSPREVKIRAAFAKALAAAKGGEAKKGPDDDAFFKLCGLGDLERRESEHAVLYWTKAASVEADALLRGIETTWLAHRYFFAGDDAGFSVEGEPKREASGAVAPTVHPNWLVVADSEHARFIESAVADKRQHDFAKGLVGWADWYKLPARAVLVFEGHFLPGIRAEWVSAGMADYMTLAPLQKRSHLLPEFLQEGVKRFFSGHVSGRAEIFYSNTGSSTGKRNFKASTFDALRAQARLALEQAPEGELRELLSKKTNDLDAFDSAVALAFFDYLLAARRAELATFLNELKEGEVPAQTLERVMKKNLEELERDLRAWVREEY